MDLSALIFVALAVAWAVYLIPKALRHHDDVVRSRSVERFSHTMRVLARREPVNRRDARLVVAPARAKSAPVVTTKGPARVDADRETVQRATRRRRRVLGLVLLANAAVVTVAAFGLIDWWYVAIPAGLLVAWLVACRLMVRRERPVHTQRVRPAPSPADEQAEAPVPAEQVEGFWDDTPTGQTPAIADPSLWDPMPVTLPTYVGKPAAERRSVRTIDLDSTGVWTSGRTEADSQIARDADEAARSAREGRKDDGGRRAVGS
ncbi:hypothetical protein [Nocardioides sp.]|uniref:divisome protein SepX/GlpR n=1 Tax=Nocardioides sp. TaxID=35761 RepID=UPI002D7E5F33|nr:hypothetical protein [Nocardioides sp.]HET8959919.1 hypothetical protein [Nocardioides sp.]